MPVGQAFSGSTEGALPWLPFLAEPSSLQKEGISAGTSFYTRSSNPLDFHEGIASGLFPDGAECGFFGNRGFGKTTAMKDLAIALMKMQAINQQGKSERMRIFVDNRKVAGQNVDETVAGEWGGLVEKLGWPVLKIRQMRLEIFDPIMPLPDQLALAIDIAEFIKGKLDIYLKLALRVIQFTITTKYGSLLSSAAFEKIGRTITPEEVYAYDGHMDNLLKERFAAGTEPLGTEDQRLLDNLVARERTASIDRLLKACGEISDIFKLLLDGEFGETFAGNVPLSEYLRKDALMFDFEDLNDREVALFEVVRFRVMTAAVKSGDSSVIPHLLVREEVQELDKFPVLLRAWAYWSATSRSRHTITFSSTQYLTSLFTPTQDPEVFKYLQMIFNGISCLVLFNQPVTDAIQDLLEKRELSPEDIARTAMLPVGAALIKFNHLPAFTNQFHIPPSVKKLIASRGAAERMAFNRIPVENDPRVKAHLEKTTKGSS